MPGFCGILSVDEGTASGDCAGEDFHVWLHDPERCDTLPLFAGGLRGSFRFLGSPTIPDSAVQFNSNVSAMPSDLPRTCEASLHPGTADTLLVRWP
jgi:hypothetical protein